MPSESYMQRTLRKLRDHDYRAEKVEYWNPHARKRIDLFGVIDVLAIRPRRVVGVQVCDQAHYAAHANAILRNDHGKRDAVLDILASGIMFEIWSWSRRKVKRGGTAVRYVLKRYRLTEDMSEWRER